MIPDHDALGPLCDAIRTTLARVEDPLVVAGALIEGAVHAVLQLTSEDGQGAAALAMADMLDERLRASGLPVSSKPQ